MRALSLLLGYAVASVAPGIVVAVAGGTPADAGATSILAGIFALFALMIVAE